MTFYSEEMFSEKKKSLSILRAEGCLYSYVRVKMGEKGEGKRETGGHHVIIKEAEWIKKVTENY